MTSVVDFSVNEFNEDLLGSMYSKLSEGCFVHNCMCKLTELDKYKTLVTDSNGEDREVNYTRYRLEYEKPTTERYVYIGVMQRVGTSNILDVDSYAKSNYIDSEDYDISIPDEIHKEPLECEHCYSGRKCKKTFLLLDLEENLFFQVAQGCLTGYVYFSTHKDIERMFKGLEVERERRTRNAVTRKDVEYYRLDRLVKHSLSHFLDMEEIKFIPRKDAYFGSKVKSSVFAVNERIKNNIGLSEKVTDDMVNELLDSLRAGGNFDSKTIEIIREENKIPVMKAGYIIYQTYRFLDTAPKIRKRKDIVGTNSDYIGEVGEKIECEVTYYKTLNVETQYGSACMYFFVTDNDDVLVWFTSKDLDMNKEERLLLKGKVKSHDSYRGINQTFVSYVKLEELN